MLISQRVSSTQRLFNEALRLDPKLVLAYFNRGNTYRDKGDLDRAIADYTEAIRLDPNQTGAYNNRGNANFYKGDFAAAANDFERANNLATDAYRMLWRYLAQRRIGQDGAAELSANVGLLKSKNWPYPVIDFYLGRGSLDELRAAAKKPEERCEAEFYIGQWLLLRDRDSAVGPLKMAADICPKTFIEYRGALAELKRLEK
jgi:lipoprotein NlpI